MKANNFRLGNLVYNTIGKPDEINIEALKYLISCGETDICQVHPIPLTEEWLLRFGFTLNTSNKHVYEIDAHCEYFTVRKYREDITFFKEYTKLDGFEINFPSYYDEVMFDKFFYVHQLQNLYFALTGKELILQK